CCGVGGCDVAAGRNTGAPPPADQAEPDTDLAPARAAARRGAAPAREQDMRAMVGEMRARVVEAEAEVPKALAAALREGRLGVLDYYTMRNLIADTEMRQAISRGGEGPEPAAGGEAPKRRE